jgi:hypothetical protein
MTNVEIKWEDGRVTTESFRHEDDFFAYVDSIKRETGIGADDFESDNPMWVF